ncbi:cysteine-rich CWC family protein [Vibrio zhanjiangensis]|uniref:cysteine-rich CWC family protein n=1 Tax=Vibrio zhanjiangensis TaxID=1046128 RepID=UPI0024E071FB|nr:cysteine-rich CWC family protein [Vibrio zhanjiangensis]
MKTPCIAACKNNGGICNGCHRTIDEIVNWKEFSDLKREEIINTVAGHLCDHLCPACHEPATCDISQGKESCWCFSVEERIHPSNVSNDLCLCRKCLNNLEIA